MIFSRGGARAVGPALAAFLIHSAIAYQGADGQTHFMSDHSLFMTFWTGAGIMLLAVLLAAYFTRVHASEYSEGSVAEAA